MTAEQPVSLNHWTDSSGQEWACAASDHGVFCRLCQPVDDALRGLVGNVERGAMEARADRYGRLQFKLTDKGLAEVGDLIRHLEES